MATLTPQQQQQFQQILNQVSQQVKNLQSQVGTLAAAKSAGMTITPQTSVEQAAAYLASKSPSTSSPKTSQTMNVLSSNTTDKTSPLDWTDYYKRVLSNPTATPEAKAEAARNLGLSTTQTQPQTQQQTQIQQQTQPLDYQKQFQDLINQFSGLVSKYQSPPPVDTSKISQIYGQTASDLKSRYEKLLQDLQKKQQEEQQKLVGRYAAAGFSEPGILGGSPAGIPGVATKGLNELESQQASDIVNLQQAEAGDINALAAAQASAEQQAQQQAIDNYYRQLQLMQSVLENEANLFAYQTPAQKLAEEIQKEEILKSLGLGTYAKYEQPKVETIKEKDGSVWEVVYDDQGKIISKSEIIPPTPKEEEKSSWQLVIDPNTGEPKYFFNKTTGKLVPNENTTSSTSTQQTAPPSGFLPNLWNKIKSFFQGY